MVGDRLRGAAGRESDRVALALLIAAGCAVVAGCAMPVETPARLPASAEMVRIAFRTRLGEAGAPVSAVTTLYRVGHLLGRVERPPDASGKRRTMIVNEPDYWVLESDSDVALHGRDQGITNRFRAPIVSRAGPPALRELEFGNELDFLRRRGGTAESVVLEDGQEFDRYQVRLADVEVELLARRGRDRPVRLQIRQGENALFAVLYDSYATGLEPDLSLFEPPAGIQVLERAP